ncbi:MAG: hypothetical protein CMM44_09715 [Rhodospirillaceae bacterium]|nr:hypothetical protein [Rhodospirillaceae bacterium]
MTRKIGLGFLSICLTVVSAMNISTEAASVEKFYKGKKVKMIVRSAPGGGYDFYARLIARHMAKHIPGNPKMIVVNMPGAGGIVAANYMMLRAKQDGTELAILSREAPISQRSKDVGVKFDLLKLNPLGSAASSTFIVTLAKNHPVKTYKQLRNSKKQVLFGASGPGAGSYTYAALLKQDGFNVKIISGFIGGASRFLAIERGNVHATANSYESTAKAIEELGLVPILYSGAKRSELAGVPHISEQLSAKGRQFAALMAAPLAAGRPFYTTPNVPADRLAVLRAAFKSAIEDPAARLEAKKSKRNVTWTSAQTVEKVNREVLDASDAVIALYKESQKKPKLDYTKLPSVAGKISDVKKKGKSIVVGGKKFKISGKRTKVYVAGKKVKRKALKVGMNCKVMYQKGKKEAVKVDCK